MTYRWEPTTPLDRILATGFKRIDEAVEGVIRSYSLNVAEKYIIRGDDFYAAKAMAETRKLQREHNYRMSLDAERLALAPRPDWKSLGASLGPAYKLNPYTGI